MTLTRTRFKLIGIGTSLASAGLAVGQYLGQLPFVFQLSLFGKPFDGLLVVLFLAGFAVNLSRG